MRVLVTGANGFIGNAVCHLLIKEGFQVRCSVRKLEEEESSITAIALSGCEAVEIGEIGAETHWSDALKEIDIVIHLAGLVHVMGKESRVLAAEYAKVNVKGTECLARSAAKAGVKRLVYMSSIKVNGEQTEKSSFTERDFPDPNGLYAVSKRDAEQSLYRVSGETGLEVIVLRTPLVYGKGVKGNMLRLLKLVDRGIPLPLANVNNCRSFIGVDNLADLIWQCAKNPKVGGETFLAADGEDVSTPELIRRIAAALGRPARLFSFPQTLLRAGAQIFKESYAFERLCGSLVVNNSKARRLLGWSAPIPMNEGLKKMADWYLSENVKRHV